MKKHIIFGGMFMALFAFASCNGDYDDWADPQSYAQGDDAAAVAVNVSAGADANYVVDNATSDTIHLVTLTTSDAYVAGYNLKNLTVNGVSIDGFIDGNDICVLKDDLDIAVRDYYTSRASTPRDLDLAFNYAAIIADGDAVALSGTSSATYTPGATPAIDEQGYAMLGQWQGWNAGNPTLMTKVSDYVYQAKVTTTDSGDNWFKFYPQSAFDGAGNVDWDANLGCEVNGDNSTFNYVVWPGDYTGVQTPVITGAGTWIVTLDMYNMTFTVAADNPVVWLVGGIQGWDGNVDSGKKAVFYPTSSTILSYTSKWTGAWDLKFWMDADFGNWDVAYGSPVDGDNSASGTLINSGAGAISAPSAEYYTFTIDLTAKTYTWTYLDNQAPTDYTNISLIGGFNGWGDDADLAIVTPHNWYLSGFTTEDTELKFRANHDWGVNWGDGINVSEQYYGNGVNNGSNIYVPAGTYDVFFNDITGQFAFIAK